MKVLAVGDIHTKLWIIDAVRQIADQYDHVVFVGDYADDWGKDPIDTINTWRELMVFQHTFKKVTLVIGNHDYAYVNKVGTSSGGYSIGTQFMLDLPDNKMLKEWLSSLTELYVLDHVVYSHAGITDTWNVGDVDVQRMWRDDSPIWARPGDVNYKDIVQVFGHTPSETCWEVQPNVWCIDTFSTYPDGTPVGDGTVLEIIDGKTFNKIKLENKNARDNNSSPSVTTRIPD